MHGEYLETLAWPEAETVLRKFAIALLPIGARANQEEPDQVHTVP